MLLCLPCLIDTAQNQVRFQGECHSTTPEAPVQSKGEKTKNPPMKAKKRGRRSDTDHTEDRRIYEAWQTKEHETYVALARVRGKNETKKDIERAIDRHRQRTKRGNAS